MGNSKNQCSAVKWENVPFEELSRSKRRQRLLSECDYACSQCGFNKTRDCGGSILEIDHIDGDHTNNAYDNLRVLCPNCHALTPNFRNWGRSNKKTSSRLRKGNTAYKKARDEKESRYLDRKREFENEFVQAVNELHRTESVSFQEYGWVQRLADELGESPQVVGRRVRRIMPDFYKEHCFARYKK